MIFHRIGLTVVLNKNFDKEIEFVEKFKNSIKEKQVVVSTGHVGSRFGTIKYLYELNLNLFNRLKDRQVDYLIIDTLRNKVENSDIQNLIEELIERYNLKIYKQIDLITIYAKSNTNNSQI